MNTINIEKRIAERLEVIRQVSEYLPTGIHNAIFNNCAKIEKYAQVAAKQLATAHHRNQRTADYDARTDTDFANQANQRKAIFQALLAGRTLSLENAAEFHTSQMHTQIAKIRAEIAKKGLPYTLCDEWYYPGEGRCKFKRYWLFVEETENK